MTDTIDPFPLPRARECPFAPPPRLRELQEAGPLTRVRLWDGSTPWLVTRYEDQQSLLSDPRCSVDLRLPGFPYTTPAFREAARSGMSPSFLNMDDPEHARIRRMVGGSFTIKRIEALRPAVQRMTDELLDAMESGPNPADLVRSLALPLPSLVICELLGVPYNDHEFFQSQSEVGLRHDVTPEQAREAHHALTKYLEDQIDEKQVNPDGGLLAEFAARVHNGELTRDEAASLSVLLLGAGHETTANMIALGTVALLENPDQLALLRDTEDPKVLANGVEELLRYLTIIHMGNRRVALQDIDVADQTIRAHEGIIIPSATANWDPVVFPEPDHLDVTRNARRHMAFGFGVHQCLGQPLARIELQIVFKALFQRFPELRLATGLDRLPFKEDGVVYGVYELPVTW